MNGKLLMHLRMVETLPTVGWYKENGITQKKLTRHSLYHRGESKLQTKSWRIKQATSPMYQKRRISRALMHGFLPLVDFKLLLLNLMISKMP